jgi:hypothetical protein
MLIRWSIPKSKTCGETVPHVCPNCQNVSRFVLVERKLQMSFNFIPIASSDFEYQAICPNCSKKFEITKETFRFEQKEGSSWNSESGGNQAPFPHLKNDPRNKPKLPANKEIERVVQVALELLLVKQSWDISCDAHLREWASKASATYQTIAPEQLYNSVIKIISEIAAPDTFSNNCVPTWRKAVKPNKTEVMENRSRNPYL